MPQVAVCRECGEEFVNRFELGKHYKTNPDHKLTGGKRSVRAQTIIESLKTKGFDVSPSRSNGKPKRLYKRKPIQVMEAQEAPVLAYCPCCGANLKGMMKALQIAKEHGLLSTTPR